MPLEIIDEIRPRKAERSAFRTIASYAIGLLSLIALLVAVSWPTKAHAQDVPLHDWNGKLLWPELVHVIEDGKVEFRGKVFDV